MSSKASALVLIMALLTGCISMASGKSIESQVFETEPYVEAAQAIARDDVATLRRLIRQGLDVNHETKEVRAAWGRDTVNLLLYATASDSVKAAEALLEAGADVNKSTKGGMAAIIMGAPSSSDALFELLLVRYKADPNKVLRIGVSENALMFVLQERRALGEKRFERAAELLRHGADVNLNLDSGDTAAIKFSKLEDWRAVHWLLQNGAKHEDRGRFGTLMCFLRMSYAANTLSPSEAFTYRDKTKDWLLARGVAKSRVDPALHPNPKCDD